MTVWIEFLDDEFLLYGVLVLGYGFIYFFVERESKNAQVFWSTVLVQYSIIYLFWVSTFNVHNTKTYIVIFMVLVLVRDTWDKGYCTQWGNRFLGPEGWSAFEIIPFFDGRNLRRRGSERNALRCSRTAVLSSLRPLFKSTLGAQ